MQVIYTKFLRSVINNIGNVSSLTLKKECLLISFEPFAPRRFCGSFTNSLKIKSRASGEKEFGMGGLERKIRLKNHDMIKSHTANFNKFNSKLTLDNNIIILISYLVCGYKLK